MTASTLPVASSRSAPAVLAAAGAAAFVAVGAAGAGLKGVVAVAGAAVLGAVLLFVRDRERTLLVLLCLAPIALLHKALGPLYPTSGGPPAVYVHVVDVLTFALYVTWWRSGTLATDLRRELRRPVLWLPLVGVLLLLPSLLVTSTLSLGIAELVRLAASWLLFVYVAVRLRTRADVVRVLVALAVVAGVELVVVAGQYVTHGPLGLSFLGTPAELTERVTADTTLGRPFGTMTHPVFLAAFLGQVSVMALSLAVNLRRPRWRLAALLTCVVAGLPMLLSHTRAGLLGLAVAAVLLVIGLALRRRLPGRELGLGLLVLLVVGAVASPWLLTLYRENLHTDHFSLEVSARGQLMHVAWVMIQHHPFVGVGLNNFVPAMDRVTPEALIFDGNPVHDLYLLYWAEAGVLGLLALAVAALPVLYVALRLTSVRDRLLSGVGYGMAAVFAFLAVEEVLVFSLRQDHPRTLFWLLAGVTVACARLAADGETPDAPVVRPRREPPPPSGTRRQGWWRPRRPVHLGIAATLLAVAAVPGGASADAAAGPLPGARLVLSVLDRPTGDEAIWTADGDGSHPTRITPADGRSYQWASWAMGGTRLVYTVRRGLLGPVQVVLARADGSAPRILTETPFAMGQPKVSPDGRSVVLTGQLPNYRQYGLFVIDLATLHVRNVSAIEQPRGAADTDPTWGVGGTTVLYASSADGRGRVSRTKVFRMARDGSGRRRVSGSDLGYDTDPQVSPDGRSVVWASYRGPGGAADGDPSKLKVKLRDWVLVRHDVATGAEVTLTSDPGCAFVPLSAACPPGKGPAYIPHWSADGGHVVYEQILATGRVCVCVSAADGTGATAVWQSDRAEIQWLDVVTPGQAPPTSVLDPGSARGSDRLLVGVATPGGLRLQESGTDRWLPAPLPVGVPGAVESARWSLRRRDLILGVRTPHDGPVGPAPRGPAGQRARTTVVLDLLGALTATPPDDRSGIQRRQSWLATGDGQLAHAVTASDTADWTGVPLPGDLRGNLTPDLSADGRWLVVASASRLSEQSDLLRIDRRTGEVYDLTSASAGVLPATDTAPRFSPDGRFVAFTTSDGEGAPDVAVVDTATGRHFRRLTDDSRVDAQPVWSPDGRDVVFASYRGSQPLPANGLAPGWRLVRVDVRTGHQTLLTPPLQAPPLTPSFAPDGGTIAFIGVLAGQHDVMTVPSAGGPLVVLQDTRGEEEVCVDWR